MYSKKNLFVFTFHLDSLEELSRFSLESFFGTFDVLQGFEMIVINLTL